MDDDLGKIKIVPDHFQVSISSANIPQRHNTPNLQPRIDNSTRSYSRFWARRHLKRSAFMWNLFTLRGLPWSSSSDDQQKVELTAAELESLQSELADIEEREAHLKAQLEHVDEILRSARFSGYLYIRTRWTALPGEPPPIDDTDVDDWLPRFVVLHGPCIFYYLSCIVNRSLEKYVIEDCLINALLSFFSLPADLSPQDSTLLSDIVEVGSLPCFTKEDDELRYSFYILTRHGLRYECSSISKIQVDAWLAALQTDCKSACDTKAANGLSEM